MAPLAPLAPPVPASLHFVCSSQTFSSWAAAFKSWCCRRKEIALVEFQAQYTTEFWSEIWEKFLHYLDFLMVLCADNVILIGCRMTNLVSNFKYLF